ncbi:hypothetical protein GCM10010515_52610 [Streptomyces fructofermentans]|uniref:Secreted protein n=1 Tax=Streptomyces fructofermentans TaxID=152141 RepID=A0A918U181_9ACTN|nr:DUF6344 domain-containing protein [Streptomyces fructofermentans]GGX78194.1 hypothetical protein GCM10010515_52610 [Streptomyces fructofermentans]
MTRNPVMNLWTAIVTAFLALCTSLGLITTTAAAAVPGADSGTEAEGTRGNAVPQDATAKEEPDWGRPHKRSLPPTMKQRIHAEAHGSSPSCRHRRPTDTTATDGAAALESVPAPARGASPVATAQTVPPAAVDANDALSAAVLGATASAAALVGATDPGTAPRTSIPKTAVGAPADPSGTTRAATGVLHDGITAARPATASGGGLPAHRAAVPCASTAASTSAGPTAHGTATPPLGAVVLPAQTSAPAPVRASAPARVPAPAPALAATGTAAL